MQRLTTFGECLTELMSSRSLSPTDLQKWMGLPNLNNVTRIMQEQTSEKAREDFLALLNSRPCPFSARELRQLQDALLVSRLGKRAYMAQRSIEALLFGEGEPPEPYRLQSGRQTLEQYLSSLPNHGAMQLIIFNCCDRAVFDAIRTLFDDPAQRIEVWHYVCINEDSRNPAMLLHASEPILFDARYHQYTVTERRNGTDANFFSSSMIFLKSGLATNVTERVLLLFENRTVELISNAERLSLFDRCMQAIARLSPPPMCMRATPGVQISRDMGAYLINCMGIERTKGIYQIKADPCVELFPTDVVLSVFRDTYPGPAYDEQARLLTPIFDARRANLINKNKHMYCLYHLEHTRRFFETGHLSDQAYMLRDYKRDELHTILRSYINLARELPNMHIHFLKPGIQPPSELYNIFAGKGVLLCRPDTDYNLSNGYDELFFTDPMFLDQFIHYYKDVLIPTRALDEAQSLALLLEMEKELFA